MHHILWYLLNPAHYTPKTLLMTPTRVFNQKFLGKEVKQSAYISSLKGISSHSRQRELQTAKKQPAEEGVNGVRLKQSLQDAGRQEDGGDKGANRAARNQQSQRGRAS